MRGEKYMKKKDKLEIQIERLKEIRADLGMNRTEFSHYVDIPLRTLEDWEAGRRQMPAYVLRLLTYYTKVERLLTEQKIDLDIHSMINSSKSEHFIYASKEKELYEEHEN